MNKLAVLFIFWTLSATNAIAQNEWNQIDEDGNIGRVGERGNGADSLGSNKEVPKGLKSGLSTHVLATEHPLRPILFPTCL